MYSIVQRSQECSAVSCFHGFLTAETLNAFPSAFPAFSSHCHCQFVFLDPGLYLSSQKKTASGSQSSLHSLSSTNYLLSRRHSFPLPPPADTGGQEAGGSTQEESGIYVHEDMEAEEVILRRNEDLETSFPCHQSISMQPLLRDLQQYNTHEI